MLQALSQKPQPLAWFFVMIMYTELAVPLCVKAEEVRTVYPAVKTIPAVTGKRLLPGSTPVFFPEKKFITPAAAPSYELTGNTAAEEGETGGPGQPEMQAFSSVNSGNMVDLFSGDFAYNIPLLDVGGYPVNLSYRSGITMDQEASWVGTGWNINPGTINRNMRGLPDDFNGQDSIKKISSIKENKTVGVSVGGDVELVGLPLTVGANLGVFHNNYKGWGIENGLNASIIAGIGAGGELTSGLSITNNSQEGLTLAPSFSIKMITGESADGSPIATSVSASLPYNSRTGIRSLQLGLGMQEYNTSDKNMRKSSSFSSSISFASPSYVPTIRMPFTSSQFTFTAKPGGAIVALHPSLFISGYVSKQKIAEKDTLMTLPAYGYLHYQEGAKNRSSVLDFNREKELVYREKPPTPHIAVPIYTYDVFSITGEGTGGMFRGYRGDIGFIHDHFIRTKDLSGRLSADFGAGNLVHGGTDLNVTRSYTQNGPWLSNNTLKDVIDFRKDSGSFEAAYFRNPSEKSVNSKQFYEAIGGDDLVSIDLYQASPSSPSILATRSLSRYKKRRKTGSILLKPADVIRKERDKRSQVISYLNAREASIAGLSKYIENYTPNIFNFSDCGEDALEIPSAVGTGLLCEYFEKPDFKGTRRTRQDTTLIFDWSRENPGSFESYTGFPEDNFSVRWTGRIKAPATGSYLFALNSDDGTRLWLNDSLFVNQWRPKTANIPPDTFRVNLIEGEFYTFKLEYYERDRDASVKLRWSTPQQSNNQLVKIANAYLYPPSTVDIFDIGNYLKKEKRLNAFRKPNHISEMTVLNNDGRRYMYGIPVYNLTQKEVTYAVNPGSANKFTGLAKYSADDNKTGNKNGQDNYYNKQQLPAYAHSFLLTGIISPDYVDLTGNGITDDDLGDGIRFNYSKIYGVTNPFKWRAPYVQDSISYNESLKTERRDDKGSYIYGEKELWFLHSVISKTMVATFVLDNGERTDLRSITEEGQKQSSGARRLKEINLYNKADFNTRGVNARPIKTVHFRYSYRLCKGINGDANSGKLTLDSLWFTYNGNNKGKQNPYIFNYSPTNPKYNIQSNDRWGSYKDAYQNPGSVPGNVVDNAEFPYALQDSLLAARNASAWSLDSINLPSGGSIKVDFESDDYAYVQNKRAMQLFKLAGFGSDTIMPTSSLNKLYTRDDENLYVYVTLPVSVTSKGDAYYKYLADINKLYFKLFVKMPSDQYSSGSEYVSCYADMANSNAFGVVNANTLWIRIAGISLKGDEDGSYSPLAKSAIQFLRLNLPSKAFPGSEIGDDIDLGEAVTVLASMSLEVIGAFSSFDRKARQRNWGSEVDLNRTFIRLNNPLYKKYGGGHRVKRIKIYDNWNKMTNQKAAMYGQEYYYTTSIEVNGTPVNISSGVASYEPGIGGDENPLRVPIEYVEKIAPLAPVALAYSEEPLGESLFPSPGIGYSKVRVRTINYRKKKSANGLEETRFYTAYDFPTITERTLLDGDARKRFRPGLANFLKINARNYISLSQGFKVELNDMHGKMRSQASYAETDFVHPIKYTENIYKTQSRLVSPVLSNEGIVMRPDGTIDTAAIIGKDVELMVDMREQLSLTNGYNLNVNVDVFTSGFPPIWAIPSLLNLAQREENLYRSVAVMKVVNRFGILDSVIQIDKGSKISTKDLMYDSETGDAILTRTQNEFNDPVYNFNYPAHWAYDGMGMAYKNIDLTVDHIDIRDGKIIQGLPVADSVYFASGDEILVAGKQKTSNAAVCRIPFSTFPSFTKIWAIDTSILKGGTKAIYFIDKNGKPYNGFDVSLKIIKSGRKNMMASIGSVTTLSNPLVYNSGLQKYELSLNTASKVLNASVAHFNQVWKTADSKKSAPVEIVSCETCCLRPLIMYLFSDAGRVDELRVATNAITVSQLVANANANGFQIDINNCRALSNNGNNLFFHYQRDSSFVNSTWVYNLPGVNTGVEYYRFRLGNALISITSYDDLELSSQSYMTFKNCVPGGSLELVYGKSTDTCFTFNVPLETNGLITGFRIIRNSCDMGISENNPGPIIPISSAYSINKLGNRYDSIEIRYYNNSTLLYNDYVSLNPINTYPTGMIPISQLFGTVNVLSGSSCDTILSSFCYSSITDTVVNPYSYGLLGKFRADSVYTYYGDRANTAASGNIRIDGTFDEFVPFWQFNNNRLTIRRDTTKWVWTSVSTLFNKKGMELENKDPLGRYNSGLYGYGETMPTAVIQNGRYRESAFEGFEDYNFSTQNCDTACAAGRHIDFGSFRNRISTTYKHTGKASLRLNGSGEQAALSFRTVTNAEDSVAPSLTFTTKTDTCVTNGLSKIKAGPSVLLPSFSPLRGTRMVISAWVKEEQSCSCVSYTNNHISVFTGGSNRQVFSPSGSIIEGWQRYEAVFDIADTASSVSISLEPVGATTVYFDDIRIHPFNANMKSFVYNPADLRLMAELDENNYASFYEYDDDGTLIRVKKETQRGIKTIKETRSALIKQ